MGLGIAGRSDVCHIRKTLLALVILGGLAPSLARAQQPAPPPLSPAARIPSAYSDLRGKPVEDVRVLGNATVPTTVILNVVRTRTGDRFDPRNVEEDYQRIYSLRKFANVEAKVEPTATGVIVVFIVSEQRQIESIGFHGNVSVDTSTLQKSIDLHEGQAIDSFRISLARQTIENIYRDKNYPYAHVTHDADLLGRTGQLVFNITEGPNVKVRKVNFLGNHSFSDDKLKDQVATKSWIFIFRPGTFDPNALDDDVAAVRRFYEGKGFFDVRVGRKVIVSPEMNEVQVTFVINEGIRYKIDRVTFKGNTSISEGQLRRELKLQEGAPFDSESLQRDVRQLVREYSPLGYIYQPGAGNPDYLRIEPRNIFHKDAGTVELVYNIEEGKSFKFGRFITKGNTRTQDKVILRELRLSPGELYNSAAIADATDRLRATPFFSAVATTPFGEDPETRDVLIDVIEQSTASFGIGAGINSNGGLGGNLTYEQKNFDITDFPENWDDIFSSRAFIGAGQNFRATLEPGTQATNASLRFTEPWIFDQPYSFTGEVYYRDRIREHYDETRAGGRVSFGKRWSDIHSVLLTLRGEDVSIHDIEDDPIRAPEILQYNGHSTVTSTAIQFRRDTVNRGAIPSHGTSMGAGWESYGTLGGDFTFQKFTAGIDHYKTIHDDLLDRRTILALHSDAGWIWGSAPFFERFYAGGIGTVRGFRFRGISPRSGLDNDPIGGDFTITATAELSFPLAGDKLRGVVFTDAGTVEREVRIGTIRTSVGEGIRLTLPLFSGLPVALDVAVPITKDHEDDTQILSFSLGFGQ